MSVGLFRLSAGLQDAGLGAPRQLRKCFGPHVLPAKSLRLQDFWLRVVPQKRHPLGYSHPASARRNFESLDEPAGASWQKLGLDLWTTHEAGFTWKSRIRGFTGRAPATLARDCFASSRRSSEAVLERRCPHAAHRVVPHQPGSLGLHAVYLHSATGPHSPPYSRKAESVVKETALTTASEQGA